MFCVNFLHFRNYAYFASKYCWRPENVFGAHAEESQLICSLQPKTHVCRFLFIYLSPLCIVSVDGEGLLVWVIVAVVLLRISKRLMFVSHVLRSIRHNCGCVDCVQWTRPMELTRHVSRPLDRRGDRVLQSCKGMSNGPQSDRNDCRCETLLWIRPLHQP